VDAKERLRLYLEQRRDAGETELVLDSMSVEDVMRLLGAKSTTSTHPASSTRGRPEPAGRERPSIDAQPGALPGDWREALRQLDQRSQGIRSDSARAPVPVPSTGNAPEPAVENAPATSPPGVREGATMTDQSSADKKLQPPSHATLPLEQIPAGIVVGSPAHELFGGPESPWRTLEDIAAAAKQCQSCALYKTAKQAVPGEGDPHADFVCVGEAPGANEDEQGRPFVGQAGQLLTKILAAINLSREQVFICNVLKHRPPGNRNPTPDEVAACSPYLVRQIELLAPKVIVALGTFAAQTLLQTKEPIGKLRGRIHRYYGVPLIVTYHPAALLRNPSWKRPTWEDVQLARRLYDRARSA